MIALNFVTELIKLKVNGFNGQLIISDCQIRLKERP